jgi:hypothetical protein
MRRLARPIATQVLIVAALLLVGLAVHQYRTQPRPVRTLVERELHGRILRDGEEVARVVPVFRRRASDYFRATRGILALTDQRVVYLALTPRDILGPDNPLPAFESRDFVPDTTLGVELGRTLLGAARAITFETSAAAETFGVADDGWEDVRAIAAAVARRQQAQRTEAARLRREAEVADSIARAPRWHVVQRGEALSTIALRYQTTPERLRELNSLSGDRIRAGQRLLVKPQT